MVENKNAKTPTDDGQPVAWTPQVWRQFRPDGTLEFQKIKRTPNGEWEDYTAPPQRKHNNGVIAERQRIVNLLMIQHEAAKGAHNYWHVAAQLIQADVASDT